MARDFLNRAGQNVGIDQRMWVVAETGGFGDAATGGLFPVAGDAIEHVNANIDFKIPREDATHRSGRSLVTRLSKKKEVKWSFESYIVPADPTGANPNLPDCHPMLLNVFGLVDETNPALKVYSLARSSQLSFRLLEEATHYSRLAVGCVADSATFTLPGDGNAMLKFEGFAQDVKLAGQSAVVSFTGNDVVVTTGHGGRFEIGGYIDVIDQADGNTRLIASRRITNIVGDTITYSGAAGTFTAGDIVVGAAPDFTATASENALLGLNGSFSTANLGSVDCELLSAEIAIKNNFSPLNAMYGTDKICGYAADKRRSVTVKLDILLNQSNFEFYSNNKKFIADNLTIVLAPQQIPAPINAAAGRTFTFNFPKVEFSVPSLEQPSDSYIKITLEGVAMSSDVNTPNGEMTLQIS